MGNAVYIFSLIGYLALSILYFVERDFLLAFWTWLGLLVIKASLKPLRSQAPLLLLTGLCFCFLFGLRKVSPWLQWPLDFYLAALFGFGLLHLVLRQPVRKLKWSFAFSKKEILSMFIINVPAIAILIWYYQWHPEIAKNWPLPEVPLWSLPLIVLLIAGLNGLREELFYRGLLQSATPGKSPVWYVIGLQAILFGFLHFANAFPQGWLGVFLTAMWGAAIALQYRIFKSLSLVWMTHAMADAIMFTIIIYTRSQ